MQMASPDRSLIVGGESPGAEDPTAPRLGEKSPKG